MIRIIVYLLLIATATKAGGTQLPGPAEYKAMGFDSTESYLIAEHIPQKIRGLLLGRIKVSNWRHYIETLRFGPDSVSKSGSMLAIYYSSGVGASVLQLFRLEEGIWELKDESADVSIGGMLGISAVDVDCDGLVEIATTCLAGAAGFQRIDIVKIDNDSLVTITPHQHGNWISGRGLRLENIDTDCGLEIIGFKDGNVKYDASIKQVYKLDRQTKSFKLQTEEKIGTRESK